MGTRVQVLGAARVMAEGHPTVELKATVRDQALGYLACEGGWVTRDRLGFLFWPDAPDELARHNVRQLLKRIRRLGWTGIDPTDRRRRPSMLPAPAPTWTAWVAATGGSRGPPYPPVTKSMPLNSTMWPAVV